MDERKAIEVEVSTEKLEQVEQVLLWYFGGDSETLLACSPELATFVAQQIVKLLKGQARFVDGGFRE